MPKIILHGDQAFKAIIRGVNFLADAVKVTEGPRGRNVILGQRALGQSPKVTRDGVTVSNYCDPSNTTEQMGADLVREAAQKTDNAVGDGTTASIVLAQAIIKAGYDAILKGANPMALERGMRKASELVIKRLREAAVDVDDKRIRQVATVSAHGDVEIGKLVADAVIKAGRDGVVTAEPSSTASTYIQSVAGLELPKSNLVSSAFITHPEEMKAELPDCKILLWEGVIATAKSMVNILKQVHASSTPLIIIAGGYEQEALAVIINNKIKLALPLIAVRMEAYGERRKHLMQDIAALTGTPAFTEDMGKKIDDVKLDQLGQARKVITDMKKTQIIEGKGNQAAMVGQIESIRKALETSTGDETAYLKRRLAALTGGITVIKVGGVTVTEMEEKKDRVVDAMNAARAAIEGGIIAGGGFGLMQCRPLPMTVGEGEELGVYVINEACFAIASQIAENAGLDSKVLLGQLMATPNLGFNAMTGKFENLLESGIIDPVSVVIESLKNATAVACSILTMGATVAELPQGKD